MATESGYSSQKKIGDAQFKTIHNLGSDRYGAPITLKTLFQVSAANAVSGVELSDDAKKVYIDFGGAHNARLGDVLRAVSGSLIGWEFEVVEIIDSDILAVLNIADSTLQAADTVDLMRWVTSTSNSNGSGASAVTITDTSAPLAKAVVDFSVSNVTNAAYTQVLATIGATAGRKAQIFMSSGDELYLAFGAAASEVDKIVVFPGGNGTLDLDIPANTRLSVKAVSAALINSGKLMINILG